MRRLALLTLALAVALPAGAQARDFPRNFLWGTAISAFQTEAGGRPANADRRSDWWVWSHDADNIAAERVSGDRVERGPGHWSRYRSDALLARRRLGANAFRMSIEWSRVFPRSTAGARTPRQLDRLANRAAVRHYARELRALRRRGLEPVLTLNHFTLPTWLHDPIAVRDAFAGVDPDAPPPEVERGGWLDPATVREFGKFAAWAAWRFRRQVDLWVTVNEPMVVAVSGYVNLPGVFAAWFPPGVFSYTAAVRAVRNLARANAVAYDAVHRHDRRARVGPVHNMIAFTPSDPASALDRRGAEHADYIFNRVYLNAVVRGIDDADVDGVVDPGERRAGLRGRADFIGLNYYFRSRVTGLPASASTTVPLFDFLPNNVYSHPARPAAGPPCPSTCTEFGWEIYPQGFRDVLRTVGSYRRPVYVTENGLADADDDQRAAYLTDHLARAARRDAGGRGQGPRLLRLVAGGQLRVGRRLLPALRVLLLQPRHAGAPRAPERRVFRRIARSGNLP